MSDSHSVEEATISLPTESRHRRKRLQLSCGECRRKKLSCSRTLPCQRCTKIGRASQCSFEAGPFQPGTDSCSSAAIQRLQAELVELKAELSEARNQRRQHDNAEKPGECGRPTMEHSDSDVKANPPDVPAVSKGLASRPPHVFYRQNNLVKIFVEIPGIYAFIRETAVEWLRPAGITLNKNKALVKSWTSSSNITCEDTPLQRLLPRRHDSDVLVTTYFGNFEYLHRIVHIPTFKAEYTQIWDGKHANGSETVILTLAVLAVAVSSSSTSVGFSAVADRYRSSLPTWITTCEEWTRLQSHKRRGLTYYQVMCLVYFMKRMNLIQKKQYWVETGRLVQEAVIGRLHDASYPANDDTIFAAEMRRRIWFVIREIDLQTSFEFGLPTILSSIDTQSAAPANVEDEAFDQSTTSIPSTGAQDAYFRTSFQYWSNKSWNLRQEISARLFSSGTSLLSYDEVLQFTNRLTQAIQAIPAWSNNPSKEGFSTAQLLTSAFLRFQLQECVLALHRPFLHRENAHFWLSENVSRQVATEVLTTNLRLADVGMQSLTLLREDLLLASLTLTHIILLQPNDPTPLPTPASISALDLLERCLPIAESRYLQQFPGEPWCFITLCAAIMLVKVHLNREHKQTAKYSCAQRFLDLHARHFTRRLAPPVDCMGSGDGAEPSRVASEASAGSIGPGNSALSSLEDVGTFDLDTEFFDFDMGVGESGDWAH